MRLYLVRHGEAKSGFDDPEKGLTDKGIEDVRKIAAFLKKMKLQSSLLWHSPKKRAIQTAGIIADIIGKDNKIEVRESLLPEADIEHIKDEIKYSDEDSIIIVGHLPHLSRLASDLLTGGSGRDIIHLGTGSTVCLQGEGEQWWLEWKMAPYTVTGFDSD